ncbi:hypothetical protein JXA32_14200 [Candidatus Sumerlaeota bacterium]|nr:hypothetical protein [Candidatus Sumerlaeota bacterium]
MVWRDDRQHAFWAISTAKLAESYLFCCGKPHGRIDESPKKRHDQRKLPILRAKSAVQATVRQLVMNAEIELRIAYSQRIAGGGNKFSLAGT